MKNFLKCMLLGLFIVKLLVPIISFASMASDTMVIYQSSSPEIKKFRVEFKHDSYGTLKGNSLIYVPEEAAMESGAIPTPVAKDGYVFDKWVNDTDTHPVTVTDWALEIINKPTVYLAMFKKKTNTIMSVTFKASEGGLIRGNTSLQIQKGSKVTSVPIVTVNKGYKFVGWYQGNNKVDPTKVTITSNTVFTAKFTEVKVAMYRLYNPNSGEHFYTASAYERDSLKKIGWHTEGIGWYSPEKGLGKPVYRLYNKNAGDHHYTLSVYERDSLMKIGWRAEGIGWYALSK